MPTTVKLTLSQLRKMLSRTPGVDVWCTGSQQIISVYDESARVWRQHAQPYWMSEADTIRKALGLDN